ncbi:hypothetical protein F5050DRAFT_1905929, partial [Lentinula boryana]
MGKNNHRQELSADVSHPLLKKRPSISIQVIAVGPVIELYGRFAAEKFARLIEIYTDRAYSKSEFNSTSSDPQQFVHDFKHNPEGLVGAAYRFKCSDDYTRFFLIERVLYCAEGIIGQAWVVVEVECVCTESDCQCDGERQVMKIRFPSRSRPSEDALIREARSKAESTGDLWALNHLPQIIDSITITYDESTVQGRLKTHPKEKYEERVMRVTILEKLHPLSELEDPRDFAQVFYDIL